jgi:serine/threonine protein kinase
LSLVGSELGRYQVLEEVGRGGMAVVYKGYYPALRRTVALKVLKPELAADPEFVERFRHEAQSAAGLNQPNIAIVYDVEQVEDTYFIVMQFLPGRTLQQEIRDHGAPPLARTVEIVRALADAVDHAHRHKLIHRDVKPNNVMIGPDGQVTLMDFGIVKAAAGSSHTQEGVRIGTPEYMSPEQAQAGKVDHRSDIYSLGVVLYEMLVGRVPFQSTSSHTVLQSHVHQPPPPPSQFVRDLPPSVEKVVLRALAKEPRKRFQTAGQMAAALEQAALPRQEEQAPSRESRLKLVTPDGHEFPLMGLVGLGRSSDNQVRVPDLQISRHHAQIRCQGTRCQIADLGSANKTFLNDQPLRPSVAYPLRPGDRVRLGPKITFVVEVDTVVEPPEEPAARRPNWLRGLWGNRRARALALLSGGIALVLIVLCLATLSLGGGLPFGAPWNASRRDTATPPTAGAPSGGSLRATTTHEMAVLAVVNDTGQDLELEIGEYRWELRAGQRQSVRFPPGEYTYRITLDNGDSSSFRGTWQPGDNGELLLVPLEP